MTVEKQNLKVKETERREEVVNVYDEYGQYAATRSVRRLPSGETETRMDFADGSSCTTTV